MTGLNAIVIDTETGSLDPETGALLELAAVEVVDGVLGRTFHRRILPGQRFDPTVGEMRPLRIDPEAAAVNGYTPEAWDRLGAQAESFVLLDAITWIGASVLRRPTLADAFDAASIPQLVWAGHNTQFDRQFIGAALYRTFHGSAKVMDLFSHRDVDLMHLALVPAMCGIVPGRSLDQMRVLLGKTVPAREDRHHDAMTDAMDTAKLLLLCLRSLHWRDDTLHPGHRT